MVTGGNQQQESTKNVEEAVIIYQDPEVQDPNSIDENLGEKSIFTPSSASTIFAKSGVLLAPQILLKPSYVLLSWPLIPGIQFSFTFPDNFSVEITLRYDPFPDSQCIELLALADDKDVPSDLRTYDIRKIFTAPQQTQQKIVFPFEIVSALAEAKTTLNLVGIKIIRKEVGRNLVVEKKGRFLSGDVSGSILTDTSPQESVRPNQ